ncbi:cytochrome c oxidase subunit II [uncultured Jatrophihabitans sp.]|uniref:aa3-type cytochrome oxidase subunit II n=1 Tax=uncultured Jatrophihabitans sp. TaxID=1610747 RepID=UPI0035CC0F67
MAVLLTGCSASDWERNLRFGWPTGATRQGTEMRVLWTWTGVTALALGIVVWGLIFWCCIRYRAGKRAEDYLPRQTKYNFWIELICFTFPFLVIAGLFYRTVVVEDNVDHLSKHPDVQVQVDAFKWNWQFEYHGYQGADGQQHSTVYPNAKDVADAAGNTQDRGNVTVTKQTCDEASSNGSYNCGSTVGANNASGALYLSTVGSQNEVPVLVIPVGRTVRFVEHSEDVIHSFWVPDFLFKRDVIPYGTASTARDNQFEITPTHEGSFVGRCAELCGTYHSQMNFEVRVVSEPTFEKYLTALQKIGPTAPNRQSRALTAAGMAPYATTTYPLQSSLTTRSQSLRPTGE